MFLLRYHLYHESLIEPKSANNIWVKCMARCQSREPNHPGASKHQKPNRRWGGVPTALPGNPRGGTLSLIFLEKDLKDLKDFSQQAD